MHILTACMWENSAATIPSSDSYSNNSSKPQLKQNGLDYVQTILLINVIHVNYDQISQSVTIALFPSFRINKYCWIRQKLLQSMLQYKHKQIITQVRKVNSIWRYKTRGGYKNIARGTWYMYICSPQHFKKDATAEFVRFLTKSSAMSFLLPLHALRGKSWDLVDGNITESSCKVLIISKRSWISSRFSLVYYHIHNVNLNTWVAPPL